jgi:copper homeostasis protein CutC
MNNIEKKLDALISALGFDVVETPVFMARPDGGDKVHIRTDIKIIKRDVFLEGDL